MALSGPSRPSPSTKQTINHLSCLFSLFFTVILAHRPEPVTLILLCLAELIFRHAAHLLSFRWMFFRPCFMALKSKEGRRCLFTSLTSVSSKTHYRLRERNFPHLRTNTGPGSTKTKTNQIRSLAYNQVFFIRFFNDNMCFLVRCRFFSQ